MSLGVARTISVPGNTSPEWSDCLSAPALAVHKLVLTDFRSYAHAEIRTDSRPVVLTGANGAGKTNILEALSYLAPGRGLRSVKLSDVARMGGMGNWAVAATLDVADGPVNVGTGIVGGNVDSDEPGTERRTVRIDGETMGSPAALAEIVRMVWLTPQMDRLFLEAPSGRRRFLDRLAAAFHVGHSRELSAYERAMRERNRLLQDGKFDPSWLGALEAQMAEHGTAVAAGRLDTVSQLATALEMSDGAFPSARLSLNGGLEVALMQRPAIEVEDEFKQKLSRLRRLDAQAGRATSGPHKTDMEAVHAARDMPAALCSTGEQKALLIGITLASARMIASQTGCVPILLLDEVVAHLDSERRAALFDEICASGAQAWLTGTDYSLFEALGHRASFFKVANSAITRSEI